MKNIVMLGVPGSGKGTQAKLISKKYSLDVVYPGDMFRRVALGDTELSKRIRGLLEQGRLVDDGLVLEMVAEYMFSAVKANPSMNGFVFDGIPRSVKQAQMLDVVLKEVGDEIGAENVSVNVVVCLSANDEDIIERLAKRIVCSGCSAVYNTATRPTIVGGRCDFCDGTDFITRTDDDREVAISRISTHKPMIKELVNYYSTSAGIVDADAMADVNLIFDVISSGIDRICANCV